MPGAPVSGSLSVKGPQPSRQLPSCRQAGCSGLNASFPSLCRHPSWAQCAIAPLRGTPSVPSFPPSSRAAALAMVSRERGAELGGLESPVF